MNIGEVAARTQLPAKTIRYYEEIGLVRPGRADNGYRDYAEEDVHRLAFLQRARGLGFTIDECRQLLSLYDDKHRASCDVKALTLEKLSEIDRKLNEMQALRDTLATLADSCIGDDRPDCPILNDMARQPQT
ncbi:MAG: Cu(I)-responsive transcriptional regulator [Pseudomonadota bacterium]